MMSLSRCCSRIARSLRNVVEMSPRWRLDLADWTRRNSIFKGFSCVLFCLIVNCEIVNVGFEDSELLAGL